MIIGMNGYAQSGKDTVAGILVKKHDFVRMAFADIMKDCLYTLNPIVARYVDDDVRVAWLVDAIGWDNAKEDYPEVRELLQRLGTEVGRNLLGEDIWVDAVMRQLEPGHDYVFSDCRFLNEAIAVKVTGGSVWRVNRPGVGPKNDHVSEVGLDDFDFDAVLPNSGTIKDLEHLVDDALHVARAARRRHILRAA